LLTNCNYYFLVMSYRKILILCTAVCHFDRSERLAKVLISYNFKFICFGRHDKTRDCEEFIIGDYYAKTNKGQYRV